MNEQLLQRIAAGESVGINDVLEVEAAAKLAALNDEAKRRADDLAKTEAANRTREQKLDEMLLLDVRAEAARRKLENVVAAKQKLLEDLTISEKQAETEWHLAHSQFVGKFAGFVPQIRSMSFRVLENQGALEKQVEEIKGELKQRGARLQAVLFNYAGRGQSFIEIPNLPPLDAAAETGEPTEPKAAESVAGL